MTENKDMETGLARLLRICPDLTLDAESIQLIVDGKQNEVISKHKGTWVEPKITGSIAIDTQEEKIKADNKSFNEYFKD